MVSAPSACGQIIILDQERKKKSKKESGILSENASFITFPFFPFAITVRIEYTLRIKNEMNPVKHSAMNREQAQTKRKLH